MNIIVHSCERTLSRQYLNLSFAQLRCHCCHRFFHSVIILRWKGWCDALYNYHWENFWFEVVLNFNFIGFTSDVFHRIFSGCSSNLLRSDVIRVEVHHTTSFQIQFPALVWYHLNLSDLFSSSHFLALDALNILSHTCCVIECSRRFFFPQASKLLF